MEQVRRANLDHQTGTTEGRDITFKKTCKIPLLVYNSKHNSNLGKTIGMRFNTCSKMVTPGPGAYEFFSDFEGFYNYGKNKKLNKSRVNEDKKSTTESKNKKSSRGNSEGKSS